MQRPRKIVSKLNQGLKKVLSGSPRQVDFLARKVTVEAPGQVCRPLKKSLTKTNKKWPGSSKM